MKIAMLLSGGVDSSVALARLRKTTDCEIIAFYLKIWLEDDLAFLGECPFEDDLKQARAVCEAYSVPLRVVSLQKPYWDRVVAHSISELKKGRTPSPDILCNQRVKFGAFTDFIDESFDKIASGHYARLVSEKGQVRLLRGKDPVKDQTYFLSGLSQKQLSRLLFPIGDLTKKEVRELALEWDLPNAARPDSQGVCFLGKIRYREFIRAHLGEKKGPIVDVHTGEKLGDHEGYWFHTIGQRKGLGLSGGPYYVCGKDLEKNIVFVEHHDQRKRVLGQTFCVEDLHATSLPFWEDGGEFEVKLRHGPRFVGGALVRDAERGWVVELKEADGGIAPGQYTVFYAGDWCLGSGVIKTTPFLH